MHRLGLAVTVLALAVACAGNQHADLASEAAAFSELGAWYGAGPSFPDGQLCLIFCENGRLFIGDRVCTKTDASDFQTSYTYEIQGTKVTTDFRKVPEFVFEIEDPEIARFSALQFKRLLLQKVADGSPLCTGSPQAPRTHY